MAQRALTPGNAAYCSECGAETLPDAAACARCGKAFEGSIEAVLCPICNSINPAGSTECVNCNARFPEPGSLTAVRPSEAAARTDGRADRAGSGPHPVARILDGSEGRRRAGEPEGPDRGPLAPERGHPEARRGPRRHGEHVPEHLADAAG